jgi:hypothetical protein
MLTHEDGRCTPAPGESEAGRALVNNIGGPDDRRKRELGLVYRLERTPYTCALHYLLRVWWPGMVLFRPPPRLRERLGFAVSKLVTLGFAVALSAVAYGTVAG